MNWTKEELDKVRQEINEKARMDQEFRTLCLKDPRKAVEQISGKVVPEGFNIRFVENEGAHLTHVLPDYISASGSELSEAELEQVSAAMKDMKGNIVHCPNCGSENINNSYPLFCKDCGCLF